MESSYIKSPNAKRFVIEDSSKSTRYVLLFMIINITNLHL